MINRLYFFYDQLVTLQIQPLKRSVLKKYINVHKNVCLSVSSQWPNHSAPAGPTEEAGQREGRSVREALEWRGLLQTSASFIPGQTPRLGPAARTQQELLPGPLLRREDGTKPERGAVLGGGDGLLPAGHGHRGPETRLHCAAVPHSELPGAGLRL